MTFPIMTDPDYDLQLTCSYFPSLARAERGRFGQVQTLELTFPISLRAYVCFRLKSRHCQCSLRYATEAMRPEPPSGVSAVNARRDCCAMGTHAEERCVQCECQETSPV